MKKKDFHLNEEQLIYSIMDQADTPPEIRRHLYHCSVCRKKRELLEEELNVLGQMANRFSPIPQKKLQIPLISPGYKFQISDFKFQISSFNPMLMTGIAAVVLMVVVSWYALPITYQKYKTAQVLKEMEADQNFMTEIRYLEENALPDAYHEISVESYGYFDEEFLDFVVPLEEENSGVQSVTL